MTRRSPADPGFNRRVREEIQGMAGERLLFIDTQNEVREAVYAVEFATEMPQLIRERLEGLGVLKGVVHVSAWRLGNEGPRISVVEYLPEKATYTTYYAPSRLEWGSSTEATQDAVASYQAFWDEFNGEENDTQ